MKKSIYIVWVLCWGQAPRISAIFTRQADAVKYATSKDDGSEPGYTHNGYRTEVTTERLFSSTDDM